MNRRRKKKAPERPSPSVRKPTAEDFSGVGRWVLSETVQHPATILPAAGSLVAVFWGAAFGMTPLGFGAILGLGFVSGAAWTYNYFFRGEKMAEMRVDALNHALKSWEVHETAMIEEECLDAGFAEGAKEAGELTAAYVKLRDFLDARTAHSRNLSAHQFRMLASETYAEGVQVLRKALSLYCALKKVNIGLLRSEHDAWVAELETLKGEAPQNRLDSLQQKIDAHKKRIEKFNERTQQVADLLAQSNNLESALEGSHLECIDLVEDKPDSVFGSGRVAGQLEQAVSAARRVEERLRQMGQPDNASDAMYEEAGRKARQG